MLPSSLHDDHVRGPPQCQVAGGGPYLCAITVIRLLVPDNDMDHSTMHGKQGFPLFLETSDCGVHDMSASEPLQILPRVFPFPFL